MWKQFRMGSFGFYWVLGWIHFGRIHIFRNILVLDLLRLNWPHWSKNVTLLTRDPNWPPWWLKNVTLLTQGSNRPFRCWDLQRMKKRTVQVLSLKLCGFMTYFRQTSFQITSQSSRGVFNLPLKLVPPMTITQAPKVVCQPSEILLVQLSRPAWRNLFSALE